MVVRFIVRFVFPILQITRTAQDRLRQMQKQMEEMQHKNTPPSKPVNNSVKEGDYIEYEEVK
jgi:hypothetical protein